MSAGGKDRPGEGGMVKWPLPRPNHTLPPKKLESWIAVIPPWSDACIHCTISMPAASTPLSEEYDIVRLLAQKEDFERRIAERDERNTDLQRKLSKAETRAREASEALVAERAERQLADKVSEREIKSLKKQLEKQQAEAKEVIADLEGRGHRATEKIATLAQAQREALEQLATSKAQIESIRAEVVRAESSVDELRAERSRRDVLDAKNEEERLSLQQALAAADAKLECAIKQMEEQRATVSTQHDEVQQMQLRLDASHKLVLEERAQRDQADERARLVQEVLEAERSAMRHDVQDATTQWRHEQRNAASACSELERVRVDLDSCRAQLEMVHKERGTWLALNEQYRHARAEAARLEGELHAATAMTRAYARHCRCTAPLAIAEHARYSTRGKPTPGARRGGHGHGPMWHTWEGPTLSPAERAGSTAVEEEENSLYEDEAMVASQQQARDDRAEVEPHERLTPVAPRWTTHNGEMASRWRRQEASPHYEPPGTQSVHQRRVQRVPASPVW